MKTVSKHRYTENGRRTIIRVVSYRGVEIRCRKTENSLKVGQWNAWSADSKYMTREPFECRTFEQLADHIREYLEPLGTQGELFK